MRIAAHVTNIWIVAAFAIFNLVFAVQAQAPGDVRVALVIGNSAYPNSPLSNPGNDAKAMGETLRRLGFVVVELHDGQKDQMVEAVAKVGALLKGKQGVGVMYYAGHGLQQDWRNYMVPVNAKLSRATDVPTQTVDLNLVIDTFKAAGNRMNILVLDACRDNPFADASSGKGLAPLDAPAGTFLAYATAPGNLAADGDAAGGNGLYTQHLLQELNRPFARIDDVFKRVRLQVRQKSQGRQIPWESSSLEEDYFFHNGKVVALTKPDEKAREAAFIAEKADWDKIKDSRSAGDFYAFLQKYPSGFIGEIAQAQLDFIERAKIASQADRDSETQDPAEPRFRLGDSFDEVYKNSRTGKVTMRNTSTVVAVTDTRVELSGTYGPNTRAIYTPAGAVAQDSYYVYDPPYPLAPGGEYQVGKRWTGRSNLVALHEADRKALAARGAELWVEVTGRIVGKEKITVAGGSFDTYKVEINLFYSWGLHFKGFYWIQPGWGAPLRITWKNQDYASRAPVDDSIREMVSRKKGGAAGQPATIESAKALSGPRVALVLGNSAYPQAPVPGAADGARAMAKTLRDLGFTVVEQLDASRAQTLEAIDKVFVHLRNTNGIGLLYYAGHALQLNARNYIVPVDAKLASSSDVAQQAVDVSRVVDAFASAGNLASVLVLDASQSSPFLGIASGKGLAQTEAPPATLLAYASAPGSLVEGEKSNGSYAVYLQEEMKTPNARIEDVFKRVRARVREQSAGKQIPWESTSIEGNFYFNRTNAVPTTRRTTERVAADR